jgi:hypothetical protein
MFKFNALSPPSQFMIFSLISSLLFLLSYLRLYAYPFITCLPPTLQLFSLVYPFMSFVIQQYMSQPLETLKPYTMTKIAHKPVSRHHIRYLRIIYIKSGALRDWSHHPHSAYDQFSLRLSYQQSNLSMLLWYRKNAFMQS